MLVQRCRLLSCGDDACCTLSTDNVCRQFLPLCRTQQCTQFGARLRRCRALLADVSHSRGCGAAAGVDVLSAEEVMMVAWVVDAQVGGNGNRLFLRAGPNTVLKRDG